MHLKKNSKVVYLRPKKKKFSKGWVIVALFLFVAIAAAFFSRPATYIVDEGTIEKGFLADALIIKNETIVTSPAAGSLELLVDSGERVRVGTPLFIIATDEAQKLALEKEIAELEQQIAELLDSEKPSMSLSVLTKSIEDTTNRLKEVVDKGELEKARALRDELARFTEEKRKYKAQEATSINALEKSLTDLKRKLTEIDVMVSAPVSGIVSFNIDGYENLLTYEDAKVITPSQTEAIKADNKNTPPPLKAKVGKQLLKIIDNFSWHLILDIEEDMRKGWYYNINLADTGERVRAKLVDFNEDKTVGTFYIGIDLKDLIDSRKVTVEVFTQTHTGKLIPVNAIFENEGTEGIYLMDQGTKKFKPIKIIEQNEEHAIVEGVKLGDKILIAKRGNPWKH